MSASSSPPAPACILFDAVGTLIVPEPPVAEVYESIGRRFGSRRTRDEIVRTFPEAFAREERFDALDPQGRTDEARERRRWRTIVGSVLDDVARAEPASFESMFLELWDHFARPTAWRLTPHADSLLRATNDGVLLGVASNFDARLLGIVRALLPMIPDERVFASSLVGYRKPALGFFRECERRLGLLPAQIELVGDDEVNDFQGATAAGWRARLIHRAATVGRGP